MGIRYQICTVHWKSDAQASCTFGKTYAYKIDTLRVEDGSLTFVNPVWDPVENCALQSIVCDGEDLLWFDRRFVIDVATVHISVCVALRSPSQQLQPAIEAITICNRLSSHFWVTSRWNETSLVNGLEGIFCHKATDLGWIICFFAFDPPLSELSPTCVEDGVSSTIIWLPVWTSYIVYLIKD